jgi:ubiquinone/menaquinone biosynthesis C-methylase UbiE
MQVDQLEAQYCGDAARQYERSRTGAAKWAAEQEELERLADQIPPGSRVLDVPVGTGRFAELLIGKEIEFVGIDVSEDMIAEARKKIGGATQFTFELGSIFHLPLADKMMDATFCIRFLNWLEIAEVEEALRELRRVTRGHVVIAIRTYLQASDIRSPRDIDRLLRKLAGIPQRRARRSGLVNHREADVEKAIRAAGLQIVDRKLLQARSDGTNYYFLRLEPLSE